jgi:hypothetical protein
MRENHGIKEKNILALLLPVGINSDNIDQEWLNLLNTFGKKRGEIAHQSAASYKTTQPIDPKEELETVKKIIGKFPGIKGLKDIDQLLEQLMRGRV